MNISEETIGRFWSKVSKTDSCWVWTDSKSSKGYGRMRVDGEYVLAHRLSVAIDGRPASNDLVVDHICRNRLCVRPDHLRSVTVKVNDHENSVSIVARLANRTHCNHGHEFSPENTYYAKVSKKNRTYRVCRTCYRARRNARNHRKSLMKREHEVRKNSILITGESAPGNPRNHAER